MSRVEEDDGREVNGRWRKGTTGNPKGRPRRAVEATYLAVFRDAVTPDDLTEMLRAVVAKAKGGDLACLAWITKYLVGIPAQPAGSLAELAADEDAGREPGERAIQRLADRIAVALFEDGKVMKKFRAELERLEQEDRQREERKARREAARKEQEATPIREPDSESVLEVDATRRQEERPSDRPGLPVNPFVPPILAFRS